MRARFLFCCLSISLFACLERPLLAQDPGKIIDQSIRAAGGNGHLSRLRTLGLEGSATRSSDGKTGSFTLDTKSPNRYYLELQIGGQPLILAYNGKSAWQMFPSGESATLLGQGALQLEAAAILANSHLLNLKKNKIGARFVDAAKSASHDALEIETTMPTGVKRRFYFDPSSHQLLREVGAIGDAELEIAYEDYRPENGIQLAHKLHLRFGDETYQININRVSVNETIGERVFDCPKKRQVQLPDLKRLFAEIDANQKAIDTIKENYSGRRSVEETQYDSSGKVSKLERREETFFYLDGQEVSTLVSRDGKPQSDEDQRKENEKARKRIEKIQEKKEHREQKEEKVREEGKEEKQRDDPGIEIFLRTSQFVNPRRERFRGQDVLVFDFEGNPDYKPKKLAERVVQQLAGVVWVDERAHDVARLEAHFVNDVKFAGGFVANLEKGTSFALEQAYLNNEVWLPTYEEAHIGARFMLVKGIKVNEVTRYSDYHRFNIETLSTIGKPKPASDPPDHP
jgi:hypothetical protein